MYRATKQHTGIPSNKDGAAKGKVSTNVHIPLTFLICVVGPLLKAFFFPLDLATNRQ